jgi:hypothetical protein
LALPSWSRGAISTVSASWEGSKKASPVPTSQASRTNSQSGGRPANSATASEACAPQRSESALSITRRRPADAPVIHVRGIACKGTVEIATRPPERPALRG